MITRLDIEYVERIAPVAQLLELLGDKVLFENGRTESLIRDQNVLQSSAKGLWDVFFYLQERLEDEEGPNETPDMPPNDPPRSGRSKPGRKSA